MRRRLTLMILPEGSTKVRQFCLSRRLIAAVLGCCGLAGGLLVYLLCIHQSNAVDLAELTRLRRESSSQRQDLQRVTASLSQLQQEMVLLAETEARIRQLANLDAVPQPLPLAMGGTPAAVSEGGVDLVQRQIDGLQLAIDLRRQSQEEVRNLLNDQVSLRRATPAGWPTRGWLTSYFGMRNMPGTDSKRIHEGLDIAASTGTPVTASADGVVARVEYSPSYGKALVLDHGYGYRTLYAHNSRILVKSGQRVTRGERISEVGNTGISTGPHLHYEVLLNGVPIDPRKTL